MAQYQFSITDLIRIPWLHFYQKQNTSRKGVEVTKDPMETISGFTEQGRSALGTPLFMPCTINGLKLANEPLIDISGGKELIKTVIDNDKGTFKELFAARDYQIVIRGFIVQEDGSDNYPEQEVSDLINKVIRQKEALSIDNKLCAMLGIDRIVVENYSLPALEGAPGLQPYELNCLSDYDYQIRV